MTTIARWVVMDCKSPLVIIERFHTVPGPGMVQRCVWRCIAQGSDDRDDLRRAPVPRREAHCRKVSSYVQGECRSKGIGGAGCASENDIATRRVQPRVIQSEGVAKTALLPRASSDHSFIVGALRAIRAPGRSL
jgi:hypothetical protein